MLIVLKAMMEFNHTNVRKISVSLIIIQTVAHYEFIWDLEAGVVHLYIRNPSLRLIKKRAERQALCSSVTHHFHQVLQCPAGVHDILHNDNILILQGFIQILYDLNDAAGFGRTAIAGNRHKIKGNRNRPHGCTGREAEGV